MQLRRKFSVASDFDAVCAALADEKTLIGLFPDAKTEVLERSEGRCTLRSKYTALGQEGEATFHFDFRRGDRVSFEKVCNGKVWKQLRGEVIAEESRGGTQLRVEMKGATKAFVPELAIRIPMERQIDEMVEALSARLG